MASAKDTFVEANLLSTSPQAGYVTFATNPPEGQYSAISSSYPQNQQYASQGAPPAPLPQIEAYAYPQVTSPTTSSNVVTTPTPCIKRIEAAVHFQMFFCFLQVLFVALAPNLRWAYGYDSNFGMIQFRFTKIEASIPIRYPPSDHNGMLSAFSFAVIALAFFTLALLCRVCNLSHLSLGDPRTPFAERFTSLGSKLGLGKTAAIAQFVVFVCSLICTLYWGTLAVIPNPYQQRTGVETGYWVYLWVPIFSFVNLLLESWLAHVLSNLTGQHQFKWHLAHENTALFNYPAQPV